MPRVVTSANLITTQMSVMASDVPLVVKLNRTITDHYPPGEVNYIEAIRALASLAASYRRAGVKLGMFPADLLLPSERVAPTERWSRFQDDD